MLHNDRLWYLGSVTLLKISSQNENDVWFWMFVADLRHDIV